MDNLIKLENVSYTVQEGSDKRKILDNITYCFDKGKITTISGPSGSGKSTLLYALAGILDITNGKIEINNVDLHKMSSNLRDDFRLNNISLIFQNLNLMSCLSVEDNILIPLHLKKRPVTKAKRMRLAEYLDLMELGQIQKRNINTLSGGEQQRVAIVRALIDNPTLILCDEPTASLDRKNAEVFMKTLVKIVQEIETTIIVVTHDENIFKYGDDKIYMTEGKLDIKKI